MILRPSYSSAAASSRRCKLASPCWQHASLRKAPADWSARLQASASDPTSSNVQAAESESSYDESAQTSTSGRDTSSAFLGNASLLRRVLSTKNAAEVLDVIAQLVDSNVTEEECIAIIIASLEKGKVDLALSIYQEMCITKQEKTLRGIPGALHWPAATLNTTSAIVLGLCQQLRIAEALQLVANMQVQGVPRTEETSFGRVVDSPLPPNRPLAVVQPQDGNKIVADADSRYELELFSGSVTSCSSEALEVASNILLDIARATGLWKKLPVAAVHEFVVQAPDGTSRTFRCGTPTPDVPAQIGHRVTVVCAPVRNSPNRRKIWSPSPPGTKPGQPMQVTNHKTGVTLPLLRPPVSSTQNATNWIMPAAVLLASGDAATYLIDPNLPLLAAAGAVAVASSAVAGNTMLIPKLKQLPENAVKLEQMRQQLLRQYTALLGKSRAVQAQTSDELRTLARLWQLQVKMEAAGSMGYEERIAIVARTRTALEDLVKGRLALLEGYARVMNMIEIEVEMDTELPDAELLGLEEQIERLAELESISEEMKLQAEARDEVEKLLRSSPA